MSETPAKKSRDDEVPESASSDAPAADTRPEQSSGTSDPPELRSTAPPIGSGPEGPERGPAQSPPSSAPSIPVSISADESVTSPTHEDDDLETAERPAAPSEESSAPRAVARAPIELPRASPPRPRSPSYPAGPAPFPKAPAMARTKTVKLPTPEVARAHASDEPPSTEPSLTDVDGTAATKPFEVGDDNTATIQSQRGRRRRDDGDEDDGPTLIAERYPVARRDDEATLVHPVGRHLEPPLEPPLLTDLDSSGVGLPGPVSSLLSHGALSAHLAERELAVQAALAAASGLTEDEAARAARRNRQALTAAIVLLGAGMVLGSLYGYLSSYALADGAGAAAAASYASLTVLTTIALFFAGTAPLQRSTELKVALVVMSGLVLLFTMVRMLTIAFG